MIELFIAFGAGLISFLSPCVLPLIPGYISYVSGSTLNELLDSKRVNIIPTALFTIGFSIVFIAFGATSTLIGNFVLANSFELRIASGAVIILFSLQLLGFFNFKFLNIEKRLQTERRSNKLYPVLVGAAFGFGWTPCIGPILGSILVLAATEESLSQGILLLFFYSIGLAIPFILSGYLIQRFLIFSKNFRKNINLVSKIGGIILLITGILILTNQLQALGYYLLNIFPFLQNFG